MSRHTDQQLPTISGNPAECMVPLCHARTAIWFGNVLSPSVQDAIFGEGFHSDMLAVCTRHYNYLKKRDGVTLGFRKVNGKLRAYVKDESF